MWAAILYGAEQMCVFKLASSINAAQDKLTLPFNREDVQTLKKEKERKFNFCTLSNCWTNISSGAMERHYHGLVSFKQIYYIENI